MFEYQQMMKIRFPPPQEDDAPAPTLTTSLVRQTPVTARGEALRRGLQKMGVFFVKIGQTAAQRPDIVGDEVR